MSNLDFCRLEVTVLHASNGFLTVEEKFNNLSNIIRYFELTNDSGTIDFENENLLIQLQFDNTQLNCELNIVDSIEDSGDVFTFKVWNIPEDTIFSSEDYLLFKYYWESDPSKYTFYHGVIKSIESKRSNADLETTIKGEIVDQNILYNWSIYSKYPKLTYYSDIKDFIENELMLTYVNFIPNFNLSAQLKNPILTREKSVGVILEQVCNQITETLLKDTSDICRWKFINGCDIIFYRNSDLDSQLLNNYYKISVPSLNYNDLLDYTNNDDVYSIEVFGLPVLKSGLVFYIDTNNTPAFVKAESAYYTADEIEVNITVSDGFIMKIYGRKTQ